MPFDDTDLKRLKELNNAPTCQEFIEWLTTERCNALLARLEAAEKLIGYRETKLGYDRLLNAWRKSKGEKG